MADTNHITKEYLQSIFTYKEGNLYWKVKHNTKMIVGSKAGAISSNNRTSVQINNKSYLLHRLIYLYHNDALPQYIDHIDGDPQNNNIQNLRPATKIQNAYNSKLASTNKSGVKGVHKKGNKWYVACRVNKKVYFLGYFVDLDLAKKTIEDFRLKHHGEFARLA